jgi:hypothetical protein
MKDMGFAGCVPGVAGAGAKARRFLWFLVGPAKAVLCYKAIPEYFRRLNCPLPSMIQARLP